MGQKHFLKFQNGEFYGEIDAKANRHGHGKMMFTDGSVYEGQWMNDQKNGMGIVHYPSGNIYEGSFLNDQKEGFGKFYYKSKGEMYEGYWQKDQKNGQGTYVFNNRNMFSGFFFRDMKHGPGTKVTKDYKYTGFWEYNLKQGRFEYENILTGKKGIILYENNIKIGISNFDNVTRTNSINIPISNQNAISVQNYEYNSLINQKNENEIHLQKLNQQQKLFKNNSQFQTMQEEIDLKNKNNECQVDKNPIDVNDSKNIACNRSYASKTYQSLSHGTDGNSSNPSGNTFFKNYKSCLKKANMKMELSCNKQIMSFENLDKITESNLTNFKRRALLNTQKIYFPIQKNLILIKILIINSIQCKMNLTLMVKIYSYKF